MKKQEQNLLIQENWLLFFLFLIFISNNDTKKMNVKEMDIIDLDKKVKFLNRIKGYMNSDEQYVLQSAETLIHIIRNIKILMDPPKIASAGVKYSSLSVEDRKRNMLMDISEFLEDEKKILVHKAVDFDFKIKTLEDRLNKIQSVSKENTAVANISQYIDVFEPLLHDEIKVKAHELKKLISIISLIGNLKNKDSFDEMDIIKLIEPLVDEEKKESLTRMVQMFQIVNSMNKETVDKDKNIKEPSNKDNKLNEDNKLHNDKKIEDKIKAQLKEEIKSEE